VTSQQQQRASAVSSANNLQFSYVTKSSGTITVGYTYVILTNTSLNVTNVGAADNNVGTVFVATGTTPTAWGTGTLGEMDMVGNTINISGAVEIQTLSKKYYQYGNIVRLVFASTPQVTHGTATSGDDCEISLRGASNIVAEANDELLLQLRNDDVWYQIGGIGKFNLAEFDVDFLALVVSTWAEFTAAVTQIYTVGAGKILLSANLTMSSSLSADFDGINVDGNNFQIDMGASYDITIEGATCNFENLTFRGGADQVGDNTGNQIIFDYSPDGSDFSANFRFDNCTFRDVVGADYTTVGFFDATGLGTGTADASFNLKLFNCLIFSAFSISTRALSVEMPVVANMASQSYNINNLGSSDGQSAPLRTNKISLIGTFIGSDLDNFNCDNTVIYNPLAAAYPTISYTTGKFTLEVYERNSDGDTGLNLPHGYKITEIVLEEASSASAGNISVGNASGGAQYLAPTALGANAIVSGANSGNLTNYFNNTGSAENIWVSSSSWAAGGSLKMYITFDKILF